MPSAIAGTPLMVINVTRKPTAVCKVSAVPRTSSSAVSVTIGENWALSATTVRPQTNKTGRTTQTELPKIKGVRR